MLDTANCVWGPFVEIDPTIGIDPARVSELCNPDCSESVEVPKVKVRVKVGDPLTHYVIVRKDLPGGIQSAQIIHAAGESSPGFLQEGTYAVSLWVENEAELIRLAAKLIREKVDFVPVFETDEPYSGALMAIGVVPKKKSQLKAHFRGLRKFSE